MAILATHLKIEIRGLLKGTPVEVVQWYEPQGAAFLTADPVGVAEAYWNDIKAVWRAMHVANGVDYTISIFVAEPGPTGQYAEYAVPTAEQEGTRASGSLGGSEMAFSAGGIRLNVGSRVTKPGQKRFWGLMEADVGGDDSLSAGYVALLNSVAPKFSQPIILGAPVATGVLQPQIVSIDRTPGSGGAILASQSVTGFYVHPKATSQVSRKLRS